MHKIFFTSLALFCGSLLFAQQNNMWYFGRKAGLNFNQVGTNPIPSTITGSIMDSNEGTASVCDKSGNLLFYTNSLTIYNRNNAVMLNGDNLQGNISTVQSAVIVPQPGNDSIFFVFTADAVENEFVNGYRYSIVNMKHAGGLGEVVSKNNLLWDSGTERMTAVRHADGVSVWLITNDKSSNIFRSWLITCTGIQPAPVVSNAGDVLNIDIYQNTGMMKVSPDGKQLCQTHFPGELSPSNFVQLFDFNNLTGVISNAKKLLLGRVVITCEYSPDSKLLYLPCPSKNSVEQVEAKLATAALIEGSRVSVNTPGCAYYGIQLAPDGKIYLAQPSSYLGAITRPNVKGVSCTHTPNIINLSPGASHIGLPSFINDFSSDPNNGFTYTIIDSCTGTVQFNGIATMAGTLSFSWDFGDGNTSNIQNPIHSFADPTQIYTVIVKITSSTSCGYVERSKLIFPAGVVAEPEFDFVAKCDSGYVRFENRSTVYPYPTAASILWDFDDGTFSTAENPIHPYVAGGVYNVKLTLVTSTPCLDRSITKPINLEILNITAFPDATVDAGQSVQLGVSGGGSEFTWTPTTGMSNPSISNPVVTPSKDTWYKVVVKNDAGCMDTDSVLIKVNPFPGVYVPSGFTPDNNGKNDVFRPIVTKEFSLEEFSIYNRYGARIFSTSQIGSGWNGKINGIPQDSGVYIWIVNATDKRNGQKHKLKGTFVIIR